MKRMLPILSLLVFLIYEPTYGESPKLPPWDPNAKGTMQVPMTDGCSVPPEAVNLISPMREINNKVRKCCVDHDEAYYYGREPEKKYRKIADVKLKECMQDELSGLDEFWVLPYYMAVRKGGCSDSKQPYRWGFGEDWGQNEKGKLIYTPKNESDEIPFPFVCTDE